jgi:transposase
MPTHHHLVQSDTAIRSDVGSIFVWLELSRSRWLVTSLAPGSEKMSKHSVAGGDGAGLLDLLTRLRDKAEQRPGTPVRIVVIQEAGLDGFWIHRLLTAHGIESHVVESASIALPRRHRRAKTDAIDGAMLVRTLMACNSRPLCRLPDGRGCRAEGAVRRDPAADRRPAATVAATPGMSIAGNHR